VPSGGGAVSAAPVAGGAAPAAAEAKEEKKEEEKVRVPIGLDYLCRFYLTLPVQEESDDDMGFGLFD
jgi:ribosomal protein L12E/L44/L45/RPP1/RPP2